MSGHSKWSTIKRKKEATDAVRGKLFSKLTRAITIAIKSGGSADPEINYKLKDAVDAAKAANMPKANIKRALEKAKEGKKLDEVVYEGFGPGGIGVIAEVVTDNRNRTAQEIKGIFERGGSRLAGPGSVSYNFEAKGLLLVKLDVDTEKQMLKLIDLGVEDVDETSDGIEVYTEPNKLSSFREILENEGFIIISVELVKKPKTLINLTDEKTAAKALSFLENLDAHDDIQKIFTNINVEEDLLKNITS